MYTQIGRYKVIRELGRGAMGVVMEAEDPKIERRVALKVLHDVPGIGAAELAEFKSRFFREAQTAGVLSHPNIVVIHDVDSDEKLGISFMAMEYLRGQTVYDLLKSGVKFTTEQAVDICIQVAEGLDHAHRQGIVHRDVKPANLMLLEDGTVKITDFGIAKISTSNLTRTGQFLGTPNYMSPEQVIGHVIDGRSDLFSLGIILYELLTGEKPFMGSSLTTITYQIVNVDPIEPSKIRPGLPKKYDAIAQKLLRKAPDERYQTGKEVAEALRQARDGSAAAQPASAAPAAPVSGDGDATQVSAFASAAARGAAASAAQAAAAKAPGDAGGNRRMVVGIAAAAVIVVLAVAVAMLMRSPPAEPVSPAGGSATASGPAGTSAAPAVASAAPGPASAPVTAAGTSAVVAATAAPGTAATGTPAPATAAGTSASPKPRPSAPTGPRPTVAPIAPSQAAVFPIETPKPAATAPVEEKKETTMNVVFEHKLKGGTFRLQVDGKAVLSLDVASGTRKKDTVTAEVSVPEGRHDVKACVESPEIQDGPKCATRQVSFVMNRTSTLRAQHGKPMVGPHWFTMTVE